MSRTLSVIGLGSVGLPLAVAFGRKYSTVAFDTNRWRIGELRQGHDRAGWLTPCELLSTSLLFTDSAAELRQADFHVITALSCVDGARRSDMLREASLTVGAALKKGDIVVFESTTYPGDMEEEYVPILEHASGLAFGSDFTLGCSPERVNPDDMGQLFAAGKKIVAGSDPETLEIVSRVYESVVPESVLRAPGIRVAEAARWLQNFQGCLEMPQICHLAMNLAPLGIDPLEVLEVAFGIRDAAPFRTAGKAGTGSCAGPGFLTDRAGKIGDVLKTILNG